MALTIYTNVKDGAITGFTVTDCESDDEEMPSGFRVIVNSREGLHQAVDHYFGTKCSGDQSRCPLCRDIHETIKK